MEVVSSGDEVEVIPKHELSLQERLSNLAGITLPNQSPPHREPPHREPPHREPPHREPPHNEGGIRPWGAPQQQPQQPHSHHQDTGPGPGKSYFKALESQNHHQEGPSKSYNKALEMAGKFLLLILKTQKWNWWRGNLSTLLYKESSSIPKNYFDNYLFELVILMRTFLCKNLHLSLQ